MYDDESNISPLGWNGGIDSLIKVITFIFNNNSGPLGRPVAMFSFIINGQNWPIESTSFKATNIILHLIIGWLIYSFSKLLIYRIVKSISINNASLIAFLTAIFWLLHPLHVSTTLYVVQRMTQLSTLFSLLSLIFFIKYHPKIQQCKKIRYLVTPSIIIFITISLAVLSKENAVVIFPILLVLHYLMNEHNNSILYRIWMFCFTILPIIVVAIYLITSDFSSGYDYKGFTILERLLTEFRVISDYILQIVHPNSSKMTLFHDDFEISHSFFKPITTAISALFIVGLLILCFTKIEKIYKLSIGWFFLWHILESTVLPLDLYFEHRNYTASIGPLMAISYGIFQLSEIVRFRKFKLLIILPTLIAISFTTQLTRLTKIWSSEEALYMHWLTYHEKSKKTLLSLVQYYESSNRLTLANNLTMQAIKYDHFSNDLGIHLKLFIQQCALKQDTQETMNQLKKLSLVQQSYSPTIRPLYLSLINNILEGNCVVEDIQNLHDILNQIEQNAPRRISTAWLSDVQSKHALLYLHYNDLLQSLDLFKKAYRFNTPDIALYIIDINLRLSNFTEAQNWITVTMNSNKSRKLGIEDKSRELQFLQSRLNTNKANKK